MVRQEQVVLESSSESDVSNADDSCDRPSDLNCDNQRDLGAA